MGRRSTQQHFIVERARALALVYLTRREDLIVTEEAADVGIDLWVRLDRDDRDGHRKFGVQVKGGLADVAPDQVNKALQVGMQQGLRYRPFPFPVVLFFFTMEDNEGWYTWVAQPVVTSGGGFEIMQHAEASCRPLDSSAINEIVEAVDRWYDTFFARAIREAPARKRDRSSAR
jgi:Domain of unknown function (DUF4365)